MSSVLDDIIGRLNQLPAKTRDQVTKDALAVTKHMSFVPLPGPQTAAYLSRADVLLYGGQAGGGKSFLLLGLASQEHKRSIIFRREAGQTDGLEEAGKQIIASRADFNGSDMEWSWADGRSVKLAGMKEPGDWNKHAGRERDLIGYDEAGEFLEEQISSLMAWNRGPTGQRCRVVLASNPPRTAAGAWMMEWFAPWLDEGYRNRAQPGELRFAVMIQGKPVWQAGPEEVEIEGELYKPLSFTFIPAALKDNPFRDTPEYRAKLNSLPEPLRSQLLKGLFALGGEDDEWQMIPTAWIKAAQDRWTPKPPDGVPMCALGADVAQGGGDDTTIAPRYDGWYDTITKVPGAQTPGGTEVAGLVVSRRKHGATIILDVGGGWGADAYGHLRGDNGMSAEECVAYMGVKPSRARSRDNLFKFTNLRSQLCWQFREALDPKQVGGSPIALPPDNELLADLAAVHYEVINRGHEGQFIKAETKEKVCDTLGRSTNKGDAVVMSWFAGARAIARALPPSLEHGRRRSGSIQVDYGPRRK